MKTTIAWVLLCVALVLPIALHADAPAASVRLQFSGLPEPASLFLLGAGLAGFAIYRRRRAR